MLKLAWLAYIRIPFNISDFTSVSKRSKISPKLNNKYSFESINNINIVAAFHSVVLKTVSVISYMYIINTFK